MKSKSLYSGDLKKPTKLSALKALGAALSGEANPYDEEILSERGRKMLLLLEHYKIDAADGQRWLLLALHLATDNVPGFKLIFPSDRKKLGRNKFWDKQKYIELVERVEKYQPSSKSRRRGKLQIMEACRYLLTREPYKSIRVKGRPITAATLARQYNLAKTQSNAYQSALSKNAYIDHPFGVNPEALAAIMGDK